MLPRLISGHPYFHETINEKEAYDIVSKSSEGNFLFCKSDPENKNEFRLVCKGMYNNKSDIRTYKCIYRADRFGSEIEYGCENIFAGLEISFFQYSVYLYPNKRSRPEAPYEHAGNIPGFAVK